MNDDAASIVKRADALRNMILTTHSFSDTAWFHFISMLNYSISGFVTRVLLSISRVVKPFLQLEPCQFKILQQQSVVWFWKQVSINSFQVYFYSNL